jgi:hypothetical protein
MESHKLHWPDWLRNVIFWILASHIAGVASAYYHTQLLVEMGSDKLFAWAGLKPWSSWSQPPKKLGFQVWATRSWCEPLALFVYWELLLAMRRFTACGLKRLPFAPQFPQFVLPGQQASKPRSIPLMCWRLGGKNRALNSEPDRENWENQALYLLVSVLSDLTQKLGSMYKGVVWKIT